MAKPAKQLRPDGLAGVLALALLVLLSGACKSQVRVPDDALQPRQSSGPQGQAGPVNNMVLVHTPQYSFYIDPFEVSELRTNEFFAVRNQNPMVNVQPNRAAAICAAAGKRLCTRFEWSNACLGTHRRRYSYANTYNDGVCRTKAEGPAITGAQWQCRTDNGIYDMVGNVMEWVADERGEMAVAVGGSYLTGNEADCFTKFYFPNQHKHEQIGFRCCRDASADLQQEQ